MQQVEHYRNELQRLYDREYEAGTIEEKPTITAEWNQELQQVNFLFTWPIDELAKEP